MSSKLTRMQLIQLISYVEDNDPDKDDFWYFGNREQFINRHFAIKKWLTDELHKLNYEQNKQ